MIITESHLSQNVFWHYVASQYFPFKTLETGRKIESYCSEFLRPNPHLDTSPSNLQAPGALDPFYMATFEKEAKISRDKLKAHKIVQESLAGIESIDPAGKLNLEGSSCELEQLIELVEKNLGKFENENMGMLRLISEKIKESYDLEKQTLRNNRLVETRQRSKVENGGAYAKEGVWTVYSKDPTIATSYHPSFLKDLHGNYERYMNRDEILNDLCYESVQEKQFMAHMEKLHYSKTEAASMKLLETLNTDTSDMNSILNQRFHVDRTLDDDARCAICSSGEYEDNDNIVFCEFCGISVHQSCYGIE